MLLLELLVLDAAATGSPCIEGNPAGCGMANASADTDGTFRHMAPVTFMGSSVVTLVVPATRAIFAACVDSISIENCAKILEI